jgi:uncharacterized membrane protein YagU involved in acid resistance
MSAAIAMRGAPRSALSCLLAGGLAAATLDLIYASTFWGIKVGLTPMQIMQSIAAGWLGSEAAYAGGWSAALLGLVSHYGIVFAMAACYYAASLRWPALAGRPLRYGPLYGVLLYAAMTYVVVPLSRAGTGALPAWRWENLSHIAVHMLLVGVPCALAAQCAMRRRTLV